eukprot:CAMPEP_0114610672 /NCGR_PEP_ID=MMETSP0168-20121206/3722_1 /TAXON_ID=95228 ORGANISM="Vannella sp., Strain DIVA3 517/6/12" /NCGR_SAMPLE_ID=MMETSP0168 /ASSEMBLY_ACC=CAM_ASM_000044 /LENGTH=588 /DNA_ID=CAMNT_0001821623 /DNA_START=105 /DNA_END=1867 /DNA_ORIENTATION=+
MTSTAAFFAAVLLMLFVASPAAAQYSATFHTSPIGTGTACTEAAPCDLLTACGFAVEDSLITLVQGTYSLYNNTCVINAANVTIQGADTPRSEVEGWGVIFYFEEAPFTMSAVYLVDQSSDYSYHGLVHAPSLVLASNTAYTFSFTDVSGEMTNAAGLVTIVADAASGTGASMNVLIRGSFGTGDGYGYFFNITSEAEGVDTAVSLTESSFDSLTSSIINVMTDTISLVEIVDVQVTTFSGSEIARILSSDNELAGGACVVDSVTLSGAGVNNGNGQLFNFWGCSTTNVTDFIGNDVSGSWVFSISGSNVNVDNVGMAGGNIASGVFSLSPYEGLNAFLRGLDFSAGTYGNVVNLLSLSEDDTDVPYITMEDITANDSYLGLADVWAGSLVLSNFAVTNCTAAYSIDSFFYLSDPRLAIVSNGNFTLCDTSEFVTLGVSSADASLTNFTNVDFGATKNIQNYITISPSQSTANNATLYVTDCSFAGGEDFVNTIIQCSNSDIDSDDRFDVYVSDSDCDIDSVILAKGNAYDGNGSCNIDVDSASNCSQAGRKWILSTIIILVAGGLLLLIAVVVIAAVIVRKRRLFLT